MFSFSLTRTTAATATAAATTTTTTTTTSTTTTTTTAAAATTTTTCFHMNTTRKPHIYGETINNNQFQDRHTETPNKISKL